MSLRTFSRSFSAGELTPELFGRIDLAKFKEGLATCRNCITLPHGPVINRAGTEFVLEVKDSSKKTRLIPFSFNSQQTFAIEIGAGYFRFHTLGATLEYSTPAAWTNAFGYTVGSIVSHGGNNYYCIADNIHIPPPDAGFWYLMPASIYEIPNPFAEADIMDIHYVQSSDVLTLVHPNYPVQELRRYGAEDWRLVKPQFQAPVNQLSGISASAAVGSGATTYEYVVTGVLSENLEESVASASASCTNDLTVTPNKNTVSWADPGIASYVRYNVYKKSNGLYGYIGQSGTTSFTDQNITPDVSKTPPISDVGFNDAVGNYPSAVSYYEQRRCFAGTRNKPQNVWMTRSGTESNMTYSIPSRDDNRIAVRIAAREASGIRHIVPISEMMLLTASSEFRATSANSDVITPSTISMKPQSFHGASNVVPAIVGNTVLYESARGGHVREMSYSRDANGYLANDISLLAPHLFDYKTLLDMAYSRGTTPILWVVSSSGKLLGMTYVPEQKVSAWHQHDTGNGDVFESICVIAEEGEDMLYCVVKRTINGQQKRYVERLHTRRYDALADAFFVDCGVTYSGAATATVSGLDWLEGREVNILADGAVMPRQNVVGGAITIDSPASKITVGIPIQADIQTMPIAEQIDSAFGQGRVKNVNKIFMRVLRSSGILAGYDYDNLIPYKQRTTEPYGSPPRLVSDEIEIVFSPSWGNSGQICVRQNDPLPLDIASMTLEVALGGG